ncbi:MAG: T9SS type A sorting domain-containing protein, partial [Bacteroidales bacterium]|nr:T9SS type A sorting domain-containing protein [Candidatus Scybalocola fimicaballi]
TGQYRYYDGLVHYLAMLHLTGSFKIWKATPSDIKEESAKGEYNGVKYTEDAVVYDFKDCQLVKVTISGNATDVENVNSNGVVIAPNPASTAITVFAEDLESVRIVDMLGRTVAESTESTVNVSNLPNGTYAVIVKAADKEVVKKINVMK